MIFLPPQETEMANCVRQGIPSVEWASNPHGYQLGSPITEMPLFAQWLNERNQKATGRQRHFKEPNTDDR